MKTYFNPPYRKDEHCSWVYDSDGKFIFQFVNINNRQCKKVIDILNGDCNDLLDVTIKDDEIFFKDAPILLIRGWGELTQKHSIEESAKIQEERLKHIYKKLKNGN